MPTMALVPSGHLSSYNKLRMFVICNNYIIKAYSNASAIITAPSVKPSQHPAPEINLESTRVFSVNVGTLCDKAGGIWHHVHQGGIAFSSGAYGFLLEGCANRKALAEGKQVHAQIVVSGVILGAKLVSMYANCGCFGNARILFDKITRRDILSWNGMIRGYVIHGHCEEALTLYYQMRTEGLQPDSFTFPFVLKACAGLAALREGKEVHNCIIRSGLESNVFVGSALVDMYVKCWNVEVAGQVFDKMPQRNVVSWTAMIAGHVQNGCPYKAFEVLRQMLLAGLKPNSVTMASLLPACAEVDAVHLGKEIHGYIIRDGIWLDVYVMNALIDMYAKCQAINYARNVFDRMSERNVVSWNTMIVGYGQNGNCDEALELFNGMQAAGVNPDYITWNAMIAGYAENGHANEALKLVQQMQLSGLKPISVTTLSILVACDRLAALQQGKEIHAFIVRSGLESEVFVGNALVDMYGKCGSIEFARKVFENLSQRDVVSWTAMIVGYAMHGHGKDAIALFHRMLQADMQPNPVTFVGILSACSHAGLLDEGWQYFECMSQDYCITPTAEHYACMVDLLGRAGHLDEAYDFVNKMPIKPGASVWGALLGACRIHGNIGIGKHAAECLFEIEPTNSGNYILLSNIYAEAGKWDDAAKVRMMMKSRGLKKFPGCSWIEVRNRVHAFIVGDVSHPQAKKIYAMLESLAGQMKAAGYMPETCFVLHDM